MYKVLTATHTAEFESKLNDAFGDGYVLVQFQVMHRENNVGHRVTIFFGVMAKVTVPYQGA